MYIFGFKSSRTVLLYSKYLTEQTPCVSTVLSQFCLNQFFYHRSVRRDNLELVIREIVTYIGHKSENVISHVRIQPMKHLQGVE